MKKTLFVCASALLLVACGKSNPAEKSIDLLKIGTPTEIKAATREEYNYDILSASFTQMAPVYLQQDGSFADGIFSPSTTDSKTFTYTVKENATWDDGEPVTADDLLFTLQYADTHDGKNHFVDVTVGEKTTAKMYESYSLSDDKKTLTLVLAKANVMELSNMATIRIMPKHIYSKYTAETLASIPQSESRVGCGPYSFASFSPLSNKIIFAARDNFFLGTPKVKTIEIDLYSNAVSAVTALGNGEIDGIWRYSKGLESTEAAALKNSDNVSFLAYSATNAPGVLSFNNQSDLFSKKSIREAVALSVDYALFTKTFGSEYASTPNRSFVPSSTIGYHETAKLERNLTAASEVLTKEGYVKDGEGFYAKEGTRLSFPLTYNSENSNQTRMAELLKTTLAEGGIQVDLDGLETAAYRVKTSHKFFNESEQADKKFMTAAIYGFTSAGLSMLGGLGNIYLDNDHAVQGGAQVTDPTFVAARNALRSAATMKDYAEAAKTMQEFYANELPVVSLYHDSFLTAYNKKLSGWKVDVNWGIYNINTWMNLVRE